MKEKPTASALSIRDLAIRYGSQTVLSNVSLDIPKDEITAIVGPSGCGKSSFLSSLNRLTDLIPGCRVSGSLEFDNGGRTNILAPDIDLISLRRRIGMVFQKPNPFPLSIRRNLELPLREHGVARGEAPGIIESALREVGLWDEISGRLDQSAQKLSGGQQQRLCIARALALNPEIILFDEPCSALDPIASGVVEDHIVALRGKVTVVVVTHNLAQARRVADHLAVFWVRDGAGTLIESGPAKAVFKNPSDPDAALYLNGTKG